MNPQKIRSCLNFAIFIEIRIQRRYVIRPEFLIDLIQLANNGMDKLLNIDMGRDDIDQFILGIELIGMR